jgi:hypothetical protein
MDNSKWLNGVWHNGTFNKSSWKFGHWLNGEFKESIWKDGIWDSGRFYRSTWKDGTWSFGTWDKGSIWKGGNWNIGLIFDIKKKGIPIDNKKVFNPDSKEVSKLLLKLSKIDKNIVFKFKSEISNIKERITIPIGSAYVISLVNPNLYFNSKRNPYKK